MPLNVWFCCEGSGVDELKCWKEKPDQIPETKEKDRKKEAGLHFVKCLHKRLWSFPNPSVAFTQQFQCALHNNLTSSSTSIIYKKTHPFSEFNCWNKYLAEKYSKLRWRLNQKTPAEVQSEQVLVWNQQNTLSFMLLLPKPEKVPFCFLGSHIVKYIMQLNIWPWNCPIAAFGFLDFIMFLSIPHLFRFGRVHFEASTSDIQ